MLALLLRAGIAILGRLVLHSGAIGGCLIALLLGGLSATVFALHRGIAIGNIAPMLRIVVPIAVAIAVKVVRIIVCGVIEVVVARVVDRHRTVTTPMAAAPLGRSNGHARAKAHHGGAGGIPRRVVRIGPTAIHRHRVVGRHVHHLGIGGLDHDHTGSSASICGLRGHGLLAIGI